MFPTKNIRIFSCSSHLSTSRCLLLIIIMAALSPSQLPAQGYIHAHVGNTLSTSGSLDVEYIGGGSQYINLDDGEVVAVGLQVGTWRKMETAPTDFGVAMELWNFKYKSDRSNTDIGSTGISLLLMLRAPLVKSDRFPQGRLNPHVAIGGNFARSSMKVSAADDYSWGIGSDLCVGATWQISQKIGFLVELRQKHLNLESSEDNYSIVYEDYDKIDGSLTMRQFLAGVVVSF